METRLHHSVSDSHVEGKENFPVIYLNVI